MGIHATASKLWLSSDLLEEALSAALQTSLTTEESRPTRFRLLLTAPERLSEAGTPRQGVLRLSFDEQWLLTAEQLRRLAPAVPFETSLIGVHEAHGELRIWGMAHSGPAWLAPTWGGRGVVPDWSHEPAPLRAQPALHEPQQPPADYLARRALPGCAAVAS